MILNILNNYIELEGKQATSCAVSQVATIFGLYMKWEGLEVKSLFFCGQIVQCRSERWTENFHEVKFIEGSEITLFYHEVNFVIEESEITCLSSSEYDTTSTPGVNGSDNIWPSPPPTTCNKSISLYSIIHTYS